MPFTFTCGECGAPFGHIEDLNAHQDEAHGRRAAFVSTFEPMPVHREDEAPMTD